MTSVPRVAVVGSINEDRVLQVDALPVRGETVITRSSTRTSGGKGANQAVAAVLHGAPTLLVGALGSDPAAGRLAAQLRARGVDTSRLRHVPGPSGTAVVIVDRDGDNCIVVESGANAGLSPDAVRESLADLSPHDVLLVQCEIPVTTIRAAVDQARTVGATVVLNWSPSVALPPEILDGSTVLVVNRGEAAALLHLADGAMAGEDLATSLSERYGLDVVVTLGADGAVCRAGGRVTAVEAVPPTSAVVDSTGAGDSFAGTLAAALASAVPLGVAVREACTAAAAAVTTLGAQRPTDSYEASSHAGQ